MKLRLSVLVVSVWLLVLGCVGSVGATILTFDDTSYQGTDTVTSMEVGYGGLNWSTYFGVYYGPGLNIGYNEGTVSGNYAAFNPWGYDVSVSIDSGTFDWNGAWFNAPHFNTYNTLYITGSVNGANLYSANFELPYASPVWFNANWTGIDTVSFTTSYGMRRFTMDDFTFNGSTPVPEPTTLLLFSTGLAGLIGGRLRGKRKTLQG